MSTTDQIINVESGGDPNATNPNSSAVGAGQFIAPTFLSVIKDHFPDLAQGKSDDEILAMRTDPNISRQATEAYAQDNQAILAKNGLPVTPGSTYLAHFAGPQGAVKILQANPNAPVSDILGAAAVKANPFLQGMTAQGLQAWAAKKMGTQAPQPGVQTAQAGGQPPSAPPQPAPQQAPIFAQAAPQAAPQAPSTPSALPFTDQAAQAQPIFVAPRKPIDLSGLQQALAQRMPIFAKQG
jgi:hypothetical protein